MVALAGFLPMFFFLTLYMQTVLALLADPDGRRLPAADGRLHHRGEHLLAAVRPHRHQAGHPRRRRDRGRRPLLALADPGRRLLRRQTSCPACWSSRSAWAASSPALTTAANAGVDEDKAGLAAGLLNTGQQLGTALGLAILSALATARTSSLLHGHDSVAQAATGGYQRALMIGAFLVLAAGAVALLARNTRQSEPAIEVEPVLDLAA